MTEREKFIKDLHEIMIGYRELAKIHDVNFAAVYDHESGGIAVVCRTDRQNAISFATKMPLMLTPDDQLVFMEYMAEKLMDDRGVPKEERKNTALYND